MKWIVKYVEVLIIRLKKYIVGVLALMLDEDDNSNQNTADPTNL